MAQQFHQTRQPSQQEVQALILLLNSGQSLPAETSAKTLLKKYPNTFILHNVLGIALDAQHKFEEAVSSYRKAAALQPRQADIHFNIGIALGNLGRIEEAISSYGKAIALQPKFFEAYGNLGTLLQKQGKLDEAVSNYRKALAIHADAIGYFNLATALRDQGKLDEAVQAYNSALNIHPSYADAHNNLGETLRDQGNMQDAVRSYQAALAVQTGHAKANYNLAEFLYLAKNYAAAIQHFEQSQLDDWQERVLYCLYKEQKFDQFQQKLHTFIATGKHVSPFLANLSTHYAINFGTQDPYNFCKNAMQFVYQNSIAELAAPGSKLLQALLNDIDSAQIAERSQGRLHYGTQSAGNLFKRPEASFRALAELIRQEFEHYRQRYAGADCELILSFPTQREFTSSWYVKMQQGGHLTSHFHELGWLSGAVYLKMPRKLGHADEGNFEYGTHGDDYPQQHTEFPTASISPQVGDIVLFPSSLFHRTIPFSSNEERICIAFDLKPATP